MPYNAAPFLMTAGIFRRTWGKINRLAKFLAPAIMILAISGCAFGPELTAENQPVFTPINSFDEMVGVWPSIDSGFQKTLIDFNNQAKNIIRDRAYVGWGYRAILQEFESAGFYCAHHMNEEGIVPHNLLVCERCTIKMEINPGVLFKMPGSYLNRIAYYWWLDFKFTEELEDKIDRYVETDLYVEQIHFRMAGAVQGLGRIKRREQIPESSYLPEAGHKLCQKSRRRLSDQTHPAEYAQPQAIY